MPINKDNTKILYRKTLTIDEILDIDSKLKLIKDEDKAKYERHINLYRDIIHFIFSDYEDTTGKDIVTNRKGGVPFIASFKLWPLCKWLLSNNRDLVEEFRDNRTPISYRSHLIQGRIASRLEDLQILGLFRIDEKKVKQTRNKKQKTDLYHIGEKGLLVALRLQLQNCDKNSQHYKIISQLALEKYLEFFYNNYQNSDNYHYYFIKSMLNKCVNGYDDLLQSFFDYVIYSSMGRPMNFSDLRYMVNNKFFIKIIDDAEFKLLFYKTLNNFEIPFVSKLLRHNIDDRNLKQTDPKETQQMIRMYLKLDVETHIDRAFSDFLGNNIALISSSSNKNQKTKSPNRKKLVKTDDVLCELIEQQHSTINYQMRDIWDIERHNNLSDSNKITLLVNCQECLQIYPYLFHIENDSLKKLSCHYCKKHSLKYFDLHNELEKLFS